MRKFTDIQRELNLMKLTDSRNGTLYCVPVAPGAPRLIVRRFDQALPIGCSRVQIQESA
jgi:hypothetical protein